MVHGVEYLREGYFGSQMTAHYDLTYMASVNLGLTVLGLAQMRKVSRGVVPE
jgi:ABC-type polysaccharide/polyol phosphate export permease